MTPSQRRITHRLRRIVISEHNYLALKRLGQGGDSFNDVISSLLRIERNHSQEKKQKKLQGQRLKQQQKNRYDDAGRSVTDVNNELNSSSFIKEAIEEHGQQMDEIFGTIKEKRE